MRLPQRSSKAFTLIELIVVIVILGILALIAIPTFGKVIGKSQDESVLTTLRSMARDTQALRALGQGTSWGSTPQDAITEATYNAASAGLTAGIAYKATSNATADPTLGEVTIKVIDDQTLVLSSRSASQHICMVGLTPTSVTGSTCVDPNPTTNTDGTPRTTTDGYVQSEGNLVLPNAPTPTPTASTPVSTPSPTTTTPAPTPTTPDIATSSWNTNLARLNTARVIASAVAAPDGSIYVMGGKNGTAHYNTVERYDPTADKWSYVAPMNKSRVNAIAAWGPDGMIYIAGGYDANGWLNSTERYDPATNKWTLLTSTLRIPRAGAAVTLDGRGGLLAISGNTSGGLTGTVERFDFATQTWSYFGPNVLASRNSGRAALSSDGGIYYVGGLNGSSVAVGNVERYDFTTNKWTASTPINPARNGHAVLSDLSGNVYSFGGGSGSANLVQRYDTGTSTWVTLPNLALNQDSAAAVVDNQGRVYLIAGNINATVSNQMQRLG